MVTRGRLDAILLTGGVARSRMLTDWVAERVSFLAPVHVLPGENEMESLALGVLRVQRPAKLPAELDGRFGIRKGYIHRKSFEKNRGRA